MDRPRYKTWIRTRPLIVFAVLTASTVALAAGLAFVHPLFLTLLLLAVPFAYILLIVGLSWWRFTARGGGYQVRIHDLLVERSSGERILDIGCGSGHLLSRIARARPQSSLVGLDYWGANWEYSQELCEANFRAEGLEGRATFVRGSASTLPSVLGEFDCVVSCMTFHEVQDAADKTVSLGQALGRLGPGGRFAFIDLFGDRSFYPDESAITAAIVAAGGEIAELVALEQLIPLPFPLKHRRVLGHAQLVAGRKG